MRSLLYSYIAHDIVLLSSSCHPVSQHQIEPTSFIQTILSHLHSAKGTENQMRKFLPIPPNTNAQIHRKKADKQFKMQEKSDGKYEQQQQQKGEITPKHHNDMNVREIIAR